MESILVIAHADESGHTLTKASLEAVTAGVELAAALAAEFTIGIVAKHAAGAVKQVAGAAKRVLAVQGDAFAQARFASDAAACTELCRAAQATLVLAPHSSRFARVMAAVAHRVGGVVDTHVAALDPHADALATRASAAGAPESIEASRWFYRQRIEAVIGRDRRPWFLLLDAGTHPAYAGPGKYATHAGEAAAAEPELIAISVELAEPRTQVTGFRAPKLDAQTIRPDAQLLFVAGAGWTKKQPDGQIHTEQAGQLILSFLAASGASLGSSKSLVDQGGDGNSVLPFLTHLNQVGQTGSTPRHAKGLATCCHGEEPHVVGWRFIGERRAISLDPNCGWARGKADVVYIADAFAVMAKVNALLAAKTE
jgi:electron transfer flavoprotein alpha subunit